MCFLSSVPLPFARPVPPPSSASAFLGEHFATTRRSRSCGVAVMPVSLLLVHRVASRASSCLALLSGRVIFCRYVLPSSLCRPLQACLAVVVNLLQQARVCVVIVIAACVRLSIAWFVRASHRRRNVTLSIATVLFCHYRRVVFACQEYLASCCMLPRSLSVSFCFRERFVMVAVASECRR
jgi:hypothetical protein